MKTSPHYLRFVQALLVATVPACSAESPTSAPTAIDPAPTETTQPNAHPAVPDELSAAQVVNPSEDASTHDAADAGYPHTSGPIVPPEGRALA